MEIKIMEWSVLPPASPHIVGEHRHVQFANKCLRMILNSQTPREETLVTLLCEVEYITNNRPHLSFYTVILFSILFA